VSRGAQPRLAIFGRPLEFINEHVVDFWPATRSLSVTYSWSRIEMIVHDVLIKTDWSLLAEQKLALLETISIVDSERRPPLEGLLSFLDHLQDAARKKASR
jgi:hypothetical protein